MILTQKKIYRSYILKARRRRFIQYSLCFLVIALVAVPLVITLAYGYTNGNAADATVVSMAGEAFTVRLQPHGASGNYYRTFLKSDVFFPVWEGMKLIVYSSEPFYKGAKAHVDQLMPVMVILTLCISAYYFIKALYFIYLRNENNKNVATLHTEGKLISCDIEKVENKSRIFRNFKIHLTYTDKLGKVHHFETERFYFNPNPYLEGIKNMQVYVDPDNYSIYDIVFPASFPSDTWHYYY
ncbi:MAG: hypothetical protein IKM61_00940 [Eubacteriaceae bacterium]|nr:hypothetical protein [Eubacteriaceae bacterium]